MVSLLLRQYSYSYAKVPMQFLSAGAAAASCLCARQQLQLLSFNFINLKRYTLTVSFCVKHCLKKVCLLCKGRKSLHQQWIIYKTVVSYIYLSITYWCYFTFMKYIQDLSLCKLPLQLIKFESANVIK